MIFLKRALGNWWVVTIAVAVLVALLLCIGLPLVLWSLRPLWVRLTLFVLVAGVWGGLVFLRIRKARKADAAIREALAGEGEAGAIDERLHSALSQLKSSAGGRRDYLYARPWYVIIGPPGAGKTTALVNSGLRFPFADQAMKGAGGTRNLDFWFADEAVLVDTAGRYTTQDSDTSADSKGWQSFLTTLRRQRPLQPVNGIIVAIGLDELATASRIEIDNHAAAVRRRLSEIARRLELKAPIYLLFTKADLIAGFTEFYDDLDVEGRRAVLGHTFRFRDGSPDAGRLAGGFDEVVQTVADRQAKRLAAEPDAQRRSLILGFPSQLGTLRARLMRFMEGAFADTGGGKPDGQLRGFYFTSGVQQGAPLDRLIGGMAEVYDQPRSAAGGPGRTYFLNRLLGEVIFPEAGLVQMEPRAHARQRIQMTGSVAAIVIGALLVSLLWTVSFVRNRHYQKALAIAGGEAAQGVHDRGIDLVEVSANDAGLEEAVGVLDQLRALPGGYGAQAAGFPPMTMRFGLYQSGLADDAVQVYQQALRRILLPRLMLRLEAVIKQSGSDPLAVYEPLKTYLMLGGQRPDGIDGKAVKGWALADWSNGSLAGADRAELRQRLVQHLDALLATGDLDAAWPGRRAPLDGNLVASARGVVQTMSLGDRAYAILKQSTAANGGPPWALARVLSSADGQAFADPSGTMALAVPYFFTKDGYQKAYQPALLTIPDEVKKDAWVLGSDSSSASIQAEMGGVRPAVAARYTQDYTTRWDKVVEALRPGALFADQTALATFIKTPSPFVLALREVRKNTSFAPSAAGKSMESALMSKASSMLGSTGGTLLTAAAADGAGGGADAGTMISQHFASLNAYVGDGKAPSPVDQLVDAVKNGGTAVIAAKASGAGSSAAMQDAVSNATAAISVQAAQAPPALQATVADIAKGGTAAQVTVRQGSLQEAYKTSLLPACRAVTQDHYPFFAAATADVSVSDAMQLFGSTGSLTGFVQNQLTPLLDTAGPVWRWKADDPAAASLDPASADAIAKTAKIRDLFVSGQPFRVQLTTLGAGVDAIEFSSGGTTNRFDTASRDPKPFNWTLQGGLPEAHVTLYKSGQKVDEIDADGPWAVFHLLDRARRENAGPTAFLATFGSSDKAATVKIVLPSDQNPFSRGGLWTFRCPVTL